MTRSASEWPIVALRDLAADEPRAITDGPFGSNLARRHYTTSGPRVIRLQNIGDGVLIDAPAHISSEHFELLRAHEAKPGDLVVASLGDLLPRACLVPEWLGPAVVKADCIRVRLGKQVEPRWVLYALQSPRVRTWAEEHRHGVGRPRLGLKAIKGLPIPLPDLSEQRRIVDILEDHLSSLDFAVAILKRQRQKLAALHDRLVDDRLFRPIDTSEHSMPTTVGEVASVISGPAFKSSRFRAEGEGIRLLRGDNVEPGSLRWTRTRTWPSELMSGYEHLLLDEGDIILAMDRPVISSGLKLAKIGKADLPALLVQRVARIRPNAATLTNYLYLTLGSRRFVRQLLGTQVGTQLPHITLQAIREFQFRMPEVDQQVAIINELGGQLARLQQLDTEIARNETRGQLLRRSLLGAAFKGQVTGISDDWDIAEGLASV